MIVYQHFLFLMGNSMRKWPDFEYHVGKWLKYDRSGFNSSHQSPWWFDALNSLPVVILGHFRHARNGDFHPKSSFSGMSEMTKYEHQYRVQLFSWFQYGFKAQCTCFLGGSDPHWLTHRSRQSSVELNRPAGFHIHTCEGKHTRYVVRQTQVWGKKHLLQLLLQGLLYLSAFQNSKQFPTTTKRRRCCSMRTVNVVDDGLKGASKVAQSLSLEINFHSHFHFLIFTFRKPELFKMWSKTQKMKWLVVLVVAGLGWGEASMSTKSMSTMSMSTMLVVAGLGWGVEAQRRVIGDNQEQRISQVQNHDHHWNVITINTITNVTFLQQADIDDREERVYRRPPTYLIIASKIVRPASIYQVQSKFCTICM